MSRAEGKERRRQQVLTAAENAIRKHGSVDFSMRKLAEDAQVSFATPFNLFGKKEDILAALFNKRVTELAQRMTADSPEDSGINRLLRVAAESSQGYLSDAELFRPLVRSFRMQSTPQLDAISMQAQGIWKEALAECRSEKIIQDDVDLDALARQLHIAFRVTFWMWAAGDLCDGEFKQQVLNNTIACLLRRTTPKGSKILLQLMEGKGDVTAR